MRRGPRVGAKVIWAVALAEARTLRRMVRTWVVWTLTFAAGLSAVAYCAFNHYVHGVASPSAGAVSPRFIAHGFSAAALCMALLGSALLAFDFRVRDEQERIVGPLDTRPLSNMEFLVGKLLALVATACLPIIVAAAFIQTGGTVASELWNVGTPLEPVSLARVLLMDLFPMLVLWNSVVIFLAAALVNRAVVALVSVVLFGGLAWYHVNVPLDLLAEISLVGDIGGLGSDILPRFASATDLVQLVAVLTMAGGVLMAAAAIHRRPDAHFSARSAGVGVATAVAGAFGIGLLGADAHGRSEEWSEWATVHAARQNEPVADVERLVGRIRIEPGERLMLDIELRLAAPQNETLRELLLSLNPGLEIAGLTVDGREVTFEHAKGLLIANLPAPLRPGSAAHLAIQASGVPDARFAYLDGAIDVESKPISRSGLWLLGTEPSLFDRGFVALMPAIRWLPTPGANFGTDRRPRDLHSVDVEVEVPLGWLVAGPGRRKRLNGDDVSERFRFEPPMPVPEFALIASRFESRRVTVEGVDVEALFHPRHRRNYDLHAGVGQRGIGARSLAESFLRRAASFGVHYPYDGLSLVEVPAMLRAYGGGWRMASVLGQPGMVLIREHGFPTAPFDVAYRGEGPNIIDKLVLYLAPYFGADFAGGNFARAATRNVFSFVSCGAGDEMIALEFLLDELASRLVAGQGLSVAATFSAHVFDQTTDSTLATTVDRLLGTTASVHEAAALHETNRPAVWDKVATGPLVSLDLDGDPRLALGVLMLKSSVTASAMIDAFGEHAAGNLLAALRRGHERRCYNVADVLDAAAGTAEGLDLLIRDYLYERSMPGYLVSPPEVVRLADDEFGRPRYQTRLHVRNDEAATGFVRLAYRGWSPSYFDGHGETLRIDGHTSLELGVVTEQPPEQATLKVYLARNRTDLRFDLPRADTTVHIDTELLGDGRSSGWQPVARSGDIVVDDLDAGFTTFWVPKKGDWLASGRDNASSDGDLDGGLPVYPAGRAAESMWQRQETPSAWGKYRRTIARASPGNGRWVVAFEAQLDKGAWRLEYHVPEHILDAPRMLGFGANYGAPPGSFELGSFDIRLVARDGEHSVVFEGFEANAGWNHLGDYDLPAGSVSLVVSNRTSGDVVVADAIRWRRLPVAEGG